MINACPNSFISRWVVAAKAGDMERVLSVSAFLLLVSDVQLIEGLTMRSLGEDDGTN